MRRAVRGCALVLTIGVMAGCAAQKTYRRAELDSRRENWDQAVLGYSKALALAPGNTRYSVALERAKLKASAEHFAKGKRYSSAKQWDLAVAELQQTLLLNPGLQYAATELEKAILQIRRRDAGPSDMERLKEKVRRAQLAPPKLNPRSNIPIVLKFPEVPVGKIFDAIGKASGINFIYDEKTDLSKPMSFDLGSETFEKALDILMLQTKNFYKVIDESTLLIAPDNRQKRQELEDQVIRTFYLSNAETKQVVAVIRTLLNSRQVAENDALNSVTIKDTPDKVAVAERIIDANDKSKGEVIIDVELLEINRTVARNLGIDLSSKTLALTFKDGQQSVPLNNLSVLKQQGNWLLGTIPSAILNLLKSDSDSKSIAKPQLRVSEGEKAEILIGDRVPIPTTSFNTSQTVGGNIVPITSFTYQNVGITVSLEPRVHHNKEVTLKVQVEVSALAGSVATGGGSSQPIIGTRQIQTVIRLRDGETNLLAGLIKRAETDSRAGVAGLSDIPGLSRVFGNSNRTRTETDIILTLTPYIIRIPDITEDDLATLWVGTEDNMRLRGPVRNALNRSPFAAPDGEGEEAAAPAEPAPKPPPTPPPGADRVTPPPTFVAPSGEAAVPAPPPEEEPEEVGGEEGETPEVEPPAEAPGAEPGSQPPSPAGEERPRTVAMVRLVPSAPSYRVGDRVVLEARIENGQTVGSVPFHLRYNKEVLEFIAPAAEGPFLGSDGSGTIFLANDLAGGGELIVGVSRMGGGEGISGSGALATFQFQAINPGDCGLQFTAASVKDSQARNLPASFVTASLRVER